MSLCEGKVAFDAYFAVRQEIDTRRLNLLIAINSFSFFMLKVRRGDKNLNYAYLMAEVYPLLNLFYQVYTKKIT